MQTSKQPRWRILFADDDAEFRALNAEVLASAGYDVATAADGNEALRLARELTPDLLLLDVSMPGRDGYAVCRELHMGSTLAPPVIFLTGRAGTGDRVTGLDAGAVDYVVKPYALAELLARVRAALRTKARADRLAAEASFDALTGLLTRRHLDARAAEAFALAQRHHRLLACLMIDVDHFKEVNDTFGHLAGDRVLHEVGRRVRASVRATDVVGRYGGEEFALVLPETDAAGAQSLAEKIRAAVAAQPVHLDGRHARSSRAAGASRGGDGSPRPNHLLTLPVHVSIGVATMRPGMRDVRALLAAADAALYRAKALGRNQVSLLA